MHHPAIAPEVLLQRLRALKQRETVNTVKRSNKSYLQEQGWLLTNGHSRPVWEGWYRSRFGSFRGWIELSLPPQSITSTTRLSRSNTTIGLVLLNFRLKARIGTQSISRYAPETQTQAS